MEAKRDPGTERPRRRAPLLRIALLVECLALAQAPSARAAPQVHVTLEYAVAPEIAGCPNDESFRASIRNQLGYDPFEPGSDRLVSVAIMRRSAGFAGRIHWHQPGGSWSGDRRISSRRTDCSSIAADLAFAVVVQVQLLSTLEGAESKGRPSDVSAPPASTPAAPQPPTEPQSPPISAAPKPTEPPPEPPPPATMDRAEIAPVEPPREGNPDAPEASIPPSSVTRLRLSAGLGSSLALGITPEATGLGRLFLNARRAWISLEFALDAAWPVAHLESDKTGFTVKRVSAATAVCGHLSLFSGCLTGAVGALRVHGTGVDAAATPTGAFYQLGVRLAATWAFGAHYFIAVRGDGLLLPSPWTVKVNDVPLWVTPRAGALLGVDVGASFF